ncbi:uncharacterized protein BDV17DRAFT_286079 [Aspergillus undulatus]|uniref:uncharacterized protein n=1 Tax=Aspergillus undulatus TaxID=1810928 RepID=UPI003CCD285E
MPTLTLYRGWLLPSHYVWSPFVTKLEARLRLANNPYKTSSGRQNEYGLLEDKAYFHNTRERWTENYYTMRNHVLSAIPYPVRILVGLLIYRSTVQTLHGQGTGRYSAEEVQGFRVEAWKAVNDLLVASKAKAKEVVGSDDGRPFWVLGGEAPTEADTTVFGFVVSVLVCDAGPKTREVVRGFPVIVEYARRIHNAYFPDYEGWAEE